MTAIAIALYALLGLLLGSVVNRLADYAPAAWLRDRERARLLPDRRLCARCGQPTRAGLESALWRFVARRGRCPACGARLPLRPVVVELAAALAFAYLWAHDVAPATFYRGQSDGVRLALHSVDVLIFLLVTVTDIEHRLILDAVMYPAMAFAVLGSVIGPNLGSLAAVLSGGAPGPLELGPLRNTLIGGAIGFVAFLVMALLGQAVFGMGALGFGDVSLATFVGLVTGYPMSILALVLGVLTGGAITALLLVARVRSLHSAVPYGPFLVVGGIAALLWGPQIVYWYFHH